MDVPTGRKQLMENAVMHRQPVQLSECACVHVYVCVCVCVWGGVLVCVCVCGGG